ncbi:CpsB/CapC family capsule biosynthesis tyrosine phosphatase, partial [Enterocloster clostridioformis]
MNTGISNKGWIDIHAHILPGVDDGAHDWDEAM